MKFELTSSQRTFYVKNGNIDNKIWNQGVILKFNTVYDYQHLNDAFNDLVCKNESLIVRFKETDSSAFMQLNDFEYTYYPFLNLSSEELDSELYNFLDKTIDLSGDLVKCVVFNTPESSGLFINSHHIVVDGYSSIVMAEHVNNYLKNPDSISSVNQKYHEYIDKENKYRLSRRFQKGKDFWSEQFSTDPLCKIISEKDFDFNYDSDIVEYNFSDNFFERISEFCKVNDLSLSSFFKLIFVLYFHKRYDINNFTIGTPVLNRTTQAELKTIGLYMHILPMIINLTDESLVENIKNIENAHMDLFRYQGFTQYDINELLKERNKKTGSLFDVVIDYEELPQSEDYDVDICYNNTLSLPMEIHVFNMGNKKKIKIRYRTSMFSKNEIENMLHSIIAIMEDAVENPNKKITEFELISVDERQKLLYTFNDTWMEYDKNKCIHELFEEQVERIPKKIAIAACDKTLTYKELNEEANRIAHGLIEKGIGKGDIVGLKLSRKSYLLSALLGILKTGAAYLPIDPDFPSDRIEYILNDSKAEYCINEENIQELLAGKSTDNLISIAGSSDICYCIYTSGSTGRPKGTLVTHRNVVNYVSENEKNVFYGITGKDFNSILSVTTAGFDIFVTETLLPLVNGKKTVLADEEQSKVQSKLVELLRKHPADILQTTPTKMRLLMADKTSLDYLKSFKAIILGGETFDSKIVKEIKEVSSADIYNIYGPTEATVWVTYAKIDEAEDISIGKPMANTQVYILDKHLTMAPIGVQGEICIAGDCISAGYHNRPEETEEKFIDNPFGEGKLYRTGDNGYWREDGNIVFVGRNDFQVKIRGLRIELGEIESAIQSVEGIDRAVVVVRKDKSDKQLICAFYTGEEKQAKEIREEIGKLLPKYMIPHTFTFLPEMPLTPSGKTDRKALPEIDLENISTETEYVAPSTEKEKLLTECICDVLGIEKISVVDNFFDIGGDSLKAIELTAKLEEKGYTVPIKTVFSCEDICELAEKLEGIKKEEVCIEYGNILPATAAQMRVYTAQILKPDSAHYNIPIAFKVNKLECERLEKALNKLIERHESLRTRFENRDGQIVQIIEETASIKLEKLDSEDVSLFNTSFDLEKAPLIKVGYCGNTVVIVTHHIVTDGESMTVLCRELNDLYMGRELGKAIQYGEFAVTDSYTPENETYWLQVFEEEITPLDIRTDFARGEIQSFNGSQVYEFLDIETHNKITEKCKSIGITPYVYYMACYSILLSKLSGSEDIVIGTPISGRKSRYLDTVGMFVNTIALRSRPEGEKKITELLTEIKDSSVEAIDNQNYPFGELLKKLKINVTGRNPIFDVMLSYQSEQLTKVLFEDEMATTLPVPVAGAKCDLNFNIIPRESDIVLMTEYCTDLFKEETINKIISMYKEVLLLCLDEEQYIKDISVAEMSLIDTFNCTTHHYNIPEKSTLYSLFEKTAKENKEKICIKTAEKAVCFKDLLRFSESLDMKIREITKETKSVIAIIAERSVEMYVAIYGIIRGGNAYLPIDPDYPQDRIDYILENSGSAAVVCQGKYVSKVKNIPYIDMTEQLQRTSDNLKLSEVCAEADDTAYVIYTSGSTGNPKGAKVSHKSAVNRILWMHDKYPLGKDDVILQKTPYTFDVSVWEHFWWGMCGGSLAVSKPGEHFLPAKILDEVYQNKVTHLHFVPSVFELFLNYLETHTEESHKFDSVRYVFLSGEVLTANLVKRFYKLYDYNKVTLHNLYGPTECAVDVTYYDCSPTDFEPVPIGRPIYNTQMYVVDKYMKPVPVGVCGELCIAGMNVGQGYLNNSGLTDEKFINNPFGEGKLYKTGDLACWREDGNIIFEGRKDTQIKLNGQRVEISEIEHVINNVPEVESVAVVVNRSGSKEILTAFYCGNAGAEELIKESAYRKLPKYMVPSMIVHLETLPLNSNGKLDRKKLAEMKIDVMQTEKFEMPIDDTEIFICNAFAKNLGVSDVGRNSNFFELGGTSLSMISLISEDGFEDISAAEFIRNSTPAELASIIKNKNKPALEILEELYVPDKMSKAMILIPFAGGGAESFGKLVSHFKKYKPEMGIYFVPYLHSLDECKKVSEEITNVLKNTEIYLYSHCVGSALAIQILRFLEKEDICIKRYFAGASIPPVKPSSKNIWRAVPDGILRAILSKAGAGLNDLSKEKLKDILRQFRKDTDFACVSYAGIKEKIRTPVCVILSKKDIFTVNYNQAELLWEKYAYNVNEIYFIDSESHYFQNDAAEELTKIILSDK